MKSLVTLMLIKISAQFRTVTEVFLSKYYLIAKLFVDVESLSKYLVLRMLGLPPITNIFKSSAVADPRGAPPPPSHGPKFS